MKQKIEVIHRNLKLIETSAKKSCRLLLGETLLLHRLKHRNAKIRRALANLRANCLEGRDLVGGFAFTAGDDSAGVAHAATGGSGGLKKKFEKLKMTKRFQKNSKNLFLTTFCALKE